MLYNFLLIGSILLGLMVFMLGWDLLLNKLFTNKWFGEG